MKSPSPWQKNPQIVCPCYSGGTFAECCQIILDPANSDKVDHNSVAAHRAALTKYLENVYGNTIPLIDRSPASEITRVLTKVDLNALAEAAVNIALALFRESRSSTSTSIFDQMSSIPLPGIEQRMLAEKVAFLDAVLDDEVAARALIRGLHISDVSDCRLLQVLLWAEDSLSPLKSLSLIDAILASLDLCDVDQDAQVVHYKTNRAICLLMLDEDEQAKGILNDEIPIVANKLRSSVDPYDVAVCARSAAMRFRLTKNVKDKEDAIWWYNRMPTNRFNKIGRANVNAEIADVHFYNGDMDNAVRWFAKSLADCEVIAVRIRLVEALIGMNSVAVARDAFVKISEESVDDSERLEYYAAASRLAFAQRDMMELRCVLKKLSELNIPQSYFREVRDRLCIAILAHVEANEIDAEQSKSTLIRMWQSIRTLSEYLELKPNVCGLGLNINKMMKD